MLNRPPSIFNLRMQKNLRGVRGFREKKANTLLVGIENPAVRVVNAYIAQEALSLGIRQEVPNMRETSRANLPQSENPVRRATWL